MKEGNAKDLLLDDAIHAAIEAEKDVLIYKRLCLFLCLVNILTVLLYFVK